MVSVSMTSFPDEPYKIEMSIREHTVVSDAPVSVKGGDLGPTPHELHLYSIGACAAITLAMYARPRKWNIGKIRVTLTEKTGPDPDDSTKQIPHIHQEIVFEGGELTQEQVDKLKEKAKDCPVHKLFMGKKVFTTSASAQAAPSTTTVAPVVDKPASDTAVVSTALPVVTTVPPTTDKPAGDSATTTATTSVLPATTDKPADTESCAEPGGGCCGDSNGG